MIHILEGKVSIENIEEFLQKLKQTGKEKNLTLQALDADKIAGKEHIMFAVEKAINSFKTGTNIANDLSKEIMLYAAGTRQINKAVKLGIHKGVNNIVIVAVGEAQLSGFDEIRQEPVLAYRVSKKEALMKIFGITNEELEAVGEEKIPDLVLERVALVDVIK
ncbi:MAG: KEOPS complex subunit Cgi121 [Methanobacteriota archaeon]